MKIELSQEDIIKEIEENYSNDVDLYFDIVDKTSTNWDSVRELTKKLIENLKENYEVADLDELLK